MNRIAACLIAGDEWREDEVKKLLESLEPHVDKFFVAYNGIHKTLPWAKWTTVPLKYEKYEWKDDFGLARNQSFALVPRNKFDWYFWADVDDVFQVQAPLADMFETLDEYTNGIFIKYNYAIEPGTGITVVEQWRERFLSTSLEWRWKWPIHEVCATPQATQLARREHCWIDHQRKSGEDRGARDRNRRILQKAAKDDPNESRHVFYLAGETMAEADVEKENLPRKKELLETAIDTFNMFRAMRNSIDEDVYLATCRIAECNRMKGDYSASLTADMEAIAIFPDWPDGSIGAAKSCMEMSDWRRMKAFADMAIRMSKPATAVSIEPLNSSFTPLFLRGIANEELGELQQALDDYKAAMKYWKPADGAIERRIEQLEGKQKEFVGREDDKRKELRGTRPEKSICFYTNPLIESWHPEHLKTSGAGGAETCIMELAPRFAADGWRTVVFGTPGEHRGVYDGIEYWDSQEYLAQEPFNVFISSRSPLPWDSEINAKAKILWLHDVNLAEHFLPYVDKPDKIVGLSQWHRNHVQKLYGIKDSKLAVIPNGINMDRFIVDRSNDTSNDPKFIWLSSPDRGLEILLALWPLLKKRYPAATLEIFYGWQMIDKIIENHKLAGHTNIWLSQLRYKIEAQLDWLGRESAGLFWRGRVPPDELAEALYRSNFWAYPTNFMETYCISAVQSQAAGVIPIASKLAALTENIACKAHLIEGWPQNVTYQRAFLNTIDDIISDDPLSEEIRVSARQKGRAFAETQSWDNSFSEWNNLFEQMGIKIKKLSLVV